jgi:hypothetical protein
MIKKIAITAILLGLFLAASLIAEEDNPVRWPSYIYIHIADHLVPWHVTVESAGGNIIYSRWGVTYVELELHPGYTYWAKVEQNGEVDCKQVNVGGETHLYINVIWPHELPQEE